MNACCVNLAIVKSDGVAKSPTSGVTAIFPDLDILMYVFTPEKPLRLGGRIIYLSIS